MKGNNETMKNLKKAVALCLSLMLLLTFPVSASAAVPSDPTKDATIDEDRLCSVDIYKYDITNAEKDGVWDSSYVSTGVYDQNVIDTLGGAVRDGDTDNKSDLGNGGESYGYAIAGVQFTYLKVADIVQFSESAADGRTDSHVQVLYGVDKVKGADFLRALGLENGAKRYTNADHLDSGKYFYQSDVLIDALAAGLEANSTVVKNAMERYVVNNGGVNMPLTDKYGHTYAENMEQGLFLFAETLLPEQVVSSCAPFLLSLPMTNTEGTNVADGGYEWMYDITLMPKNLTGIPELEKTLRENIESTGNNGGSTTDITDGYAHTGTASAGDTIDYQIIAGIPTISSEATYLSCFTFVDTIAPGVSYNRNDVVIEIFTDDACTDLVTTWTEADGKFTVTYGNTSAGESVMTVAMTSRGLEEINTSKAVYPGASMVNSGYSDCTLRITYQATMDSDNSLVYGDDGNPNKVVLTWSRSNSAYYDTLVDDCHLYTYGVDLIKTFSDGRGDFSEIQFTLRNDTDGYYVVAELNEAEGVYYVTGKTSNVQNATYFTPVAHEVKTDAGTETVYKILVKGIENDTYFLKETHTDSAYTLLKDEIKVVITTKESTVLCDIYESDVLGLVQNDPRFAESIIKEAIQKGYIKTDGGLADVLNNMPQKQLAHYLLTASAVVDAKDVTMLDDNGSDNALVPIEVTNTRGFTLPQTGDYGTLGFTIVGILTMAGAAVVLVLATRKKRGVR